MIGRRVAFATALACLSLGLGAAGSAAAASPTPHGPTAGASVIGGHPASIAELPWLVFVTGRTFFGHEPFSCTGTVVAPRVVLTAGHCVEDLEALRIESPRLFRVRAGSADIRAPVGPPAKVTEALIYPGFEVGKMRGDAGLLILATPLAVPALPLASSADAALLAAGTEVSISGWGLTDPFAEDAPTHLRSATTRIQPPGTCRSRSKEYLTTYTPAQQLCTVSPRRHPASGCFGDSGGPAIAQRPDGTPAEVGIISTGGPGCSTTQPNIFTRVDLVSPWVASWIAAVELGAPAPAVKVPTGRRGAA